MVWVLCELALRPEAQQDVLDEVQHFLRKGQDNLTHEDLKTAVRTDSFIREVMRTKGDTFSTVRMAVKDVQLGQYNIPKGRSIITSCRTNLTVGFQIRLYSSPECICSPQRPVSRR